MPNPGPKEPKGPSEIIDYTSRNIKTIPADATVQEAGRMMDTFSVGSLLVVKDGRYAGIVTDTDLARKGAARGINPEKEPIKSLMSSPIITIEGDRSVEETQAFMKARGVRHLAVTEEGTIVGIVTLSDVIRYYANFFATTE
jgi:CBS domain-containing protein